MVKSDELECAAMPPREVPDYDAMTAEQALDHALVTTHIGTLADFRSPHAALRCLLQYERDLAAHFELESAQAGLKKGGTTKLDHFMALLSHWVRCSPDAPPDSRFTVTLQYDQAAGLLNDYLWLKGRRR